MRSKRSMRPTLGVLRQAGGRAFYASLLVAAFVVFVWIDGSSCARRASPKEIEGTMKLVDGDPATRCPAALVETRVGGTDPGRYVVPTDDARASMKEAARRLVAEGDEAVDAVQPLLGRAGFELVRLAEMEGVVLLRELQARKKGGGAYLVRTASSSHVFVQAPHTFFDQGTLPLACELFARDQARALFIDTAHRYKAADETSSGEHPADLAHSEGSIFQAMTEGILAGASKVVVVQLHGFAPREGSPARVVVSSGEAKGTPLVDRTAAALKEVTTGVKKFPDSSSELGATTNVQGVLVRAAGGAFLHVEIEARLRRDLLANPEPRAAFVRALASALEDA